MGVWSILGFAMSVHLTAFAAIFRELRLSEPTRRAFEKKKYQLEIGHSSHCPNNGWAKMSPSEGRLLALCGRYPGNTDTTQKKTVLPA